MSYTAAIDQLNAMVPELYTAHGGLRRKFSLDEVRTLLTALGNPERRLRCVLIAGTNGKGSTASTLASILNASGVRTGLYTSPHLERVNERIRIGSTEIADEVFAGLYFRVQDAAERLVLDGSLPQLPSFFEVLTALALVYFADEGVELAVLEVGMGGRLDATNVVDPLLSVITDISLDHTEWLGSTVAAITREKAGILRRGGTLITLPQQPEADQVLGEVAAELEVRSVSAVEYLPAVQSVKGTGFSPYINCLESTGLQPPRDKPAENAQSYRVKALGVTVEVTSPLTGAHQQRNVALAIAAAVELAALIDPASKHGLGAPSISAPFGGNGWDSSTLFNCRINKLPITAATIAEGIRQTRWPGRLERIQSGGTEWILDVAHNPAGALALCSSLAGLQSEVRPRHLVFGCLRDKPVAEMAQILFPLFEQVILAPIHSARAAAMEELAAAGKATGTPVVSAASVREALQWASERGQGGAVVVSGSVYLVGEARTILRTEAGNSQ
jgi:dihydrofolate synthase/folylpolyglutamate synthase